MVWLIKVGYLPLMGRPIIFLMNLHRSLARRYEHRTIYRIDLSTSVYRLHDMIYHNHDNHGCSYDTNISIWYSY